LFIAPLWVAAVFQLPMAFGYLVGLVFGVGVTGLCAWLPLNMAQSRIDRLGE
jgi:hypothetical protein